MIRKPIPLFTTHIPKKAPKAVANLITSSWINRGKVALEFENEFKKMFGSKYALSTNSCTSALRMAYNIVYDLYPKEPQLEIITTPFTMVATNTAILECGLKPVFVDIEYETANINPDCIEEAITYKTIGIVGVDYAGYPCNWFHINPIANHHHLYVIEDAAHALGAKYFGLNSNNMVDISCFSFQAIKHITTGDGGMFATGDEMVYELAKKKIWYGIDKDKRLQTALGTYPQDIETLGFKYGMNDIAATMGLYGLKDLDKILRQRKYIATCYREELSGIHDITLMEYRKGIESANWLFPMHIEDRSRFAIKMRKAGIEVAVHNWRNDQYSIFGGQKHLENVNKLNNDLIHIPLHQNLNNDEVEYIISTIKKLKW